MDPEIDNGPSEIVPVTPDWMLPKWPNCQFRIRHIFYKFRRDHVELFKFLIIQPSEQCMKELNIHSNRLRIG